MSVNQIHPWTVSRPTYVLESPERQPFPPRRLCLKAAEVPRDLIKKVQSDDSLFSGGHLRGLPAPRSRGLGDVVVKRDFFIEPKQVFVVPAGCARQVAAIRVRDVTQAGQPFFGEEKSGREIKIKNHPPFRVKAFLPDDPFVVAKRRAHDEVAFQ